MELSLNISSTPVCTKVQKKEISKKFPTKLNKCKQKENGFSFEFTKTDKIKAVVARKRTNLTRKNPISIANINTVKRNISTERHNFVRRPSHSDSDNDDIHNFMPKFEEIETNLSLNVTKGHVVPVNEKKPKISRDERLKLKREERFGEKRKNINHVLTQEEINDGIKKFSQIPGKPKKLNDKMQNTVKQVNLFKNNPETKIIGQRLVKPIREVIFTGTSLDTMNLHSHCVKNLADILNIKELTTVQQKTIPHVLAGKNLLVRSQTGSGKTLAYALPMVQKLQEIRPKITRNTGILAVIIVPTRELAIQTYELMLKLLKPYQWIVPGFLTGGEKRKAEKARLRKGINILVGTPGRLVDHLLHTESFKLDKSQMLILDEADRLLEMGYERDVKQIVEAINDHRRGIFKSSNTDNDKKTNEENDIVISFQKPNIELQSLLLSATLTTSVQKLAGLALKDPLFIDNSDEDMSKDKTTIDNFEETVQDAVNEGKLVIPENLLLSYVVVPPKLRLVSLTGLLALENKEKKIMIFMATTEMVNFHHDLLNETLTDKVLDDEEDVNDSENDEEPILKGIRFFKLHGSLTQQERSGVFKAFKDAKSGILLTTDVAGRGLDVPEVDLVIQYSPPQKISDFVHRVGRTARAGRSGRAILFIGPGETDFIRILEDKRIRISQNLMDNYLNVLNKFDSEAHSTQEAASNLQHKFEELIREDKEMHERASKAFVSWLKNYSSFPKDLKQIFNIKTSHMGHFAKSFALRDPPTNFAYKHTTPKAQLPTNRLTYTKRDEQQIPKSDKRNEKPRLGTKVGLDGGRRGGQICKRGQQKMLQNGNSNYNKMNRFSRKSMALSISEFDSGIPAKKKKK